MKTIERVYCNQYSDVDLNKRVFISSIINYFQDIFVHVSLSEGIGKGIEYMNAKNLTWVIYRWQLNVYMSPDCKDKLIVKMTPASYKKSYMNVKFSMYDEKGNKIADAFSLWILLDTKENRPSRNKIEDEDICRTFGLEKWENKIDTMKNADILRLIETEENMYSEKRFKVGYSDIDTNKHANNVRYISWFIEPIAQYLIKGYEIKEMKISYRKAAVYGDIVKSSCHVDEDGNLIRSLHKVTDGDNSLLAASEIFMEKR